MLWLRTNTNGLPLQNEFSNICEQRLDCGVQTSQISGCCVRTKVENAYGKENSIESPQKFITSTRICSQTTPYVRLERKTPMCGHCHRSYKRECLHVELSC